MTQGSKSPLQSGVALYILIVFLSLGARPMLASAATATTTRHGDQIFQSRCIVCHTKKPGDSSPFGPPNLYNVFQSKPPELTTQQAITIITHGKGQMPSFGTVLTEGEMMSVLAYLRTHQ